MLDWLGEAEAAKAIEGSVGRALLAGGSRTPDLGGTATTQEAADAILAELALALRA
jgi:isocitrate/isopropylmalate dehydrogenase